MALRDARNRDRPRRRVLGWSEALSDTGEQTDRGPAIAVAGAVVAIELFAIAIVRSSFMRVPLRSSFLAVATGGAIVVHIGAAIGGS